MPNTNISITPGTGAAIDAFSIPSNGDLQQIIRQAAADAVSSAGSTSWGVSTTASTSQIAADENRVAMLIYNGSTVRVYIRFDSTAPVAAGTNAHWYLDSGDRFEVPYGLCQLPISIIGSVAGSGNVNFTLGTES